MRALILSHVYADPLSRGKLRALAGDGVELMLALPGGSTALDGSIRLTPVPVKGDSSRPGRLHWSARDLRRIFSDFRPDLVHLEEPPGTQGAAAAAAAARRLRIPDVVFSDDSLHRRRGLFEARRYARTVGHASGVIGGNRLAADLLARSAPKGAPGAVIPQFGVTPAAPIPRPEIRPGLRLGFVGRLVPERGGESLLRAVAQLMGPWTLTVVGTGPEQEALEALAQRLGLASRIRWLGGVPRSALDPVWADLDCLVVASRDTGTWVERANPVLLEAMSRGIAPVVTRAGALPELVGDAGVVVDDPETLADTLQELLADPARVRAVGERARQRILVEFVDAAVAERTRRFWEAVVAGSPRQREAAGAAQ
ncbi:MAG TPA: glycosyltransferase family 4 protein [Gemmatimonadales bacterium]